MSTDVVSSSEVFENESIHLARENGFDVDEEGFFEVDKTSLINKSSCRISSDILITSRMKVRS